VDDPGGVEEAAVLALTSAGAPVPEAVVSSGLGP